MAQLDTYGGGHIQLVSSSDGLVLLTPSRATVLSLDDINNLVELLCTTVVEQMGELEPDE